MVYALFTLGQEGWQSKEAVVTFLINFEALMNILCIIKL